MAGRLHHHGVRKGSPSKIPSTTCPPNVRHQHRPGCSNPVLALDIAPGVDCITVAYRRPPRAVTETICTVHLARGHCQVRTAIVPILVIARDRRLLAVAVRPVALCRGLRVDEAEVSHARHRAPEKLILYGQPTEPFPLEPRTPTFPVLPSVAIAPVR